MLLGGRGHVKGVRATSGDRLPGQTGGSRCWPGTLKAPSGAAAGEGSCLRLLVRAAHLGYVGTFLTGAGEPLDTPLVRRRAGIRGPTLPPLGEAEETRLAYRIEAGLAAEAALSGDRIRVDATRAELKRVEADGRQAWERFLLSNLRLVLSVSGLAARRSGLSEDDLFQEGVWALAEALRSFNPQVARFTTHALPRIRGHVRAVAASRGGAVGLKARDAVVLRRAQAIAARIEAESGRPAPVEDVASELGRGTVWTARLLAHRQPLLTGQTSDDRSPFRTPEPIEEYRLDDLADCLQRLSGIQRQVLALHYGFTDGRPRSYRAISEALGISATDARRTCEAALAVLREARSDGEVRRTPGRRSESPAKARRVLAEIDRWSRKGLSLLEVAIAMRTGPEALYEACRVSGSEALLTRLTRMELRMSGPQPAGTNVLENTIRRAAATRRRSGDRTCPLPIEGGHHQHSDPALSRPRHSPALSSPGL